MSSDFIGAAVLLKGTTGKGGTFPPIRPKKGRVLAFLGAWGAKVFCKEVNIVPREYLRLSRRNREELIAAFDELKGT